MNTCTCGHCGCVLSVDEEFVFQDEIYCEDCLDELTVLCDHCGRRIYCDNAECDSNLTLCDHCFSNHSTSCERCGRLIPNEDAYYEELMKRVATSRRKTNVTEVVADTSSSYAGTK